MKTRNENGITLIMLIITIILMLLLAGLVLTLSFGSDGLIGKAKDAKEETNKQTATEKIQFKITNSQINKYAQEQRMPTLQELADDFCEDDEIEYVELKSKKIASLAKIKVEENGSFFTKIKTYPYEFEINESLKLASIDGIMLEDTKTSNKISAEIGDKILYKNNTFKVVSRVGSAITMACIPDKNTPTIKLGSWKIFETCEKSLNNACRNYFTDETLGIKSEDIYNARKTDYDNGWLEIPTNETSEYWLSSGYIRDTGKANIYLNYVARNSGISGKLTHIWESTTARNATLSICPIITFDSALLKRNNEGLLCIE